MILRVLGVCFFVSLTPIARYRRSLNRKIILKNPLKKARKKIKTTSNKN